MISVGEGQLAEVKAVHDGDKFLGELVKFDGTNCWYALRDSDGAFSAFKLRRDAIAWLTGRSE